MRGGAGTSRASGEEGGDGSGVVGVVAVGKTATDGSFLDGIGSNESGLLESENCGAGVFALGVFEGLARDGVDVGVGHRDDFEATD